MRSQRNFSLKEQAVSAVNALNQVRQSCSAQHHVGLNLRDCSVVIGRRWGLASCETRVNIADSHIIALVGPCGVVLRVQVRGRRRVSAVDACSSCGVPVPVGVAEGHNGVASVFVDHRVPDAVQVGDTIHRRDFLRIATLVTARVGRIDLSLGVEWLMDVPDVVDNKAKSERKLVSRVGE